MPFNRTGRGRKRRIRRDDNVENVEDLNEVYIHKILLFVLFPATHESCNNTTIQSVADIFTTLFLGGGESIMMAKAHGALLINLCFIF